MNEHWHDVVSLEELVSDTPHGVDIGNTRIVLLRKGDTVRALEGTCPHAGAKLENGSIAGDRLICPWHMAEFRVNDGALLSPPALRGLCTFATRVENGRVMIDLSAVPAAAAYNLSSKMSDVVIVGNGAAACAAMVGLRDFGYTGRLTVVGPRAEEPIDRTQLSKMALAGKKSVESLALLDHDTQTRLQTKRIMGSVVSLDPQGHTVTVDDGQVIRYDRCIIATGSEAKKPDFRGATSRNIFTLRTQDDLQAIVNSTASAHHVVVLGTSFIALEAASALKSRGLEVTVVGRAEPPFAKIFGLEVANAIQRLHEKNGVKFRLGSDVEAAHDNELGLDIELQNKERIRCEFAIVGYGVTPSTTAFKNLPRTCDGGIEVDADLQVMPDLYAIGDIAAVPDRNGERVRIEHWRVAEQHGFLAARNVLGAAARFDEVPFFWTQQHGKRLTYIGHAQSWDKVVIDGDLDGMQFVAWYVKEETIVAALLCGKERATTILVDQLNAALSLEEARKAIVS